LDSKYLRAAGFAEMLRIIREEEPQVPSQLELALKEMAVSVARDRRTDPIR